MGNGSYVQTAHNNISSRMLLMQQQQQQARGGRGDSSAAFRAPGGPIGEKQGAVHTFSPLLVLMPLPTAVPWWWQTAVVAVVG